MQLNLTKKFLIVGLVIASIGANAAGFKKSATYTGMVITPEKFYEIVENTKGGQVAINFGTPDSINTMREPSGAVSGVVWVYHNAVAKQDKKMDANFMIVNGELKYVTLSNDS